MRTIGNPLLVSLDDGRSIGRCPAGSLAKAQLVDLLLGPACPHCDVRPRVTLKNRAKMSASERAEARLAAGTLVVLKAGRIASAARSWQEAERRREAEGADAVGMVDVQELP